ncbi:hypothetical protein [Portibacter marinus]|uniref:hypothetical protein n=1 Tax=Portibacter marinus TaxID=2898660 RepID=UPI001F2E5F1B|nr:hypothetical protein [Portibacter marinus]
MKYWIHVAVIFLVGFILCQWLPWWVVSMVAAVSAFLLRSDFWLIGMFGFLAGFVLWGGYAMYIDIENQHLLANRIGVLFGGVSNIIPVIFTALIGGLLCMLGSMLGASLNKSFSASPDE